MSSSVPSSQNNALIPTVFLIGVTVLLVFIAIPRPYHDPLPVTPTPEQIATKVAVVEPTPEDHVMLMALGLEEVPASSVRAGSRLFSTTCTACHGSDAKGILGLGKPLIDSGFVDQLNDEQLVAFLHVGRLTTDPENTTGVAMPAKGGNPSLSDDDLNAIVDYIRSLNGAMVVNDVEGNATPIPTARPFEAISLGAFSGAASSTPSTVTSEDSTASAPVVSQEATLSVTASPTSQVTPVTSYGYQMQNTTTEEPSTCRIQGENILDPAMTATVFAEMRKADQNQRSAAFSELTGQELAVLALVAHGLSNRQIAVRLYLGEGTVRNYVSSMLAKIGLSNRAEAAAYAVKNNIDEVVPPPDDLISK